MPQNKGPSCFFRLWNSRWPTEHHIYIKPELGYIFVLVWDIDFNFFCFFSRSYPQEKWEMIIICQKNAEKCTKTAGNCYKTLTIPNLVVYWDIVLKLSFLEGTTKIWNYQKSCEIAIISQKLLIVAAKLPIVH